jgi:hypothetical protein
MRGHYEYNIVIKLLLYYTSDCKDRWKLSNVSLFWNSERLFIFELYLEKMFGILQSPLSL